MTITQLINPVGLLFEIDSNPKDVDNEALALGAIGKLETIKLKTVQGDSMLNKKVVNERNVLFVFLP